MNGAAKQTPLRRWTSRTTAITLLAVSVALVYFLPFFWHRPLKARTVQWRVLSPPQPMRLDILSSRISKVQLKRDGACLTIWLVPKLLLAGGLRIENELEMRIHNKLPAPFRVRGINMTANMRMLGSDSLYEVGYQALTGFTAPPFGSSLTTAKYVLNDLRPSMVLALFRDVLAQYGSEKPMLETYTLGHVQLW